MEAEAMMRFGVSCVAEEPDRFRRRVELIEDLGFDLLGVGDSPAFGDVYVSLGVAAERTRSVRLGPTVTNPLTRTLSVTAGAIRTLTTMTEGRAFLGLGAGDSAVRRWGRSPARLADLREAIRELGQLGVGHASAGRPPLLLAANGPRTLELAGALADGVIIGSSLAPDELSSSLDIVRRGADTAGRTADALETWVVVRAWVADDPEREADKRDTLLASAANHVYQGQVPADADRRIGEAIRQLNQQYRYEYHGRAGDNPNGALVAKLGLREFLMERFGWVDDAEGICRRLRDLADGTGVTGVLVPAVAQEPDVLIRRLGERVLPTLRAGRRDEAHYDGLDGRVGR